MSDGYLILLVLTVVIAASKGRSVLGWAILGIFLPLISFILILVLPPIYRCRGRW